MNRSIRLLAILGALGAAACAAAAWGEEGSKTGPPGPNDGRPALVNPYHGMQERVETFAFAQKPAVGKEGDPSTSSGQGKWVITFATTADCDATVTVLGKDGKVLRHLASGVLGKNAPWPFQQNSRSQKILWDGLKDDFSRADPAGCVVRVSLGLKPVFERNIHWDQYDIPDNINKSAKERKTYFVGKTGDGGRVVGGVGAAGAIARVFDRDWKYVRTVYPPPSDEMGAFCRKRGIGLGTTRWGDNVPILYPEWQGGFYRLRFWGDREKHIDVEHSPDLIEAMTGLGGAKDIAMVPWAEAGLPEGDLPVDPKPWLYKDDKNRKPRISLYLGTSRRLAVDPVHELLYGWAGGGGTSNCGLVRFDGKTGAFDPSWIAKCNFVAKEFDCGRDGLLYVRSGGQSTQWIFRLDRDAVPVPFSHNAESMSAANAANRHIGKPPAGLPKDMTAVYSGVADRICNTHEKGFDVSANGNILSVVEMNPDTKKGGEWMLKNAMAGKPSARYLVVWDREGRLLSPDAIQGNIYGHGVRMDRDGNIYRAFGGLAPSESKLHEGIVEGTGWTGTKSIVKFRGSGGKYPAGTLYSDAPRAANIVSYKKNESAIPAGALKLRHGKDPAAAAGGLWAYGPVSTDTTNGCCSCYHQRFDLDGWGRLWVPNSPCCSVMVIDGNGNRVLRLGRYGNVDDTGTDVKAGRDGLRFACIKAVAVSDTAAYVHDEVNRRILKAMLQYAAEETVRLP